MRYRSNGRNTPPPSGELPDTPALPFPLAILRQFASPIDPDTVFETSADLTSYLSNARRHPGQLATCLEVPGTLYVMNNARDAWIEVSGGSAPVDSVFGRTGEVVAQAGDYTAADVGAAPTSHGHAISDVTNLQNELNNKAALNVDQEWTAAQYGAYVALTDAPTISINSTLGNNFKVMLGGNRILGLLSPVRSGQSGFIEILQDSAGNRTLSFDAGYVFAGGVAPTMSTAPNALDVLSYMVLEDETVLIGSALAVA